MGQSTHSFAANDKAAAVAAAMWAKSCLAHLDCLPSKALLAETKESGMAAKRNKSSQIEAVLHLRYRAQKFACICCAGPKARGTNIKIEQSLYRCISSVIYICI